MEAVLVEPLVCMELYLTVEGSGPPEPIERSEAAEDSREQPAATATATSAAAWAAAAAAVAAWAASPPHGAACTAVHGASSPWEEEAEGTGRPPLGAWMGLSMLWTGCTMTWMSALAGGGLSSENSRGAATLSLPNLR